MTSHRISLRAALKRTLLLLTALVLLLPLGLSTVSAASTVTINTIPNRWAEEQSDGTWTATIRPSYKKAGSVVIDSAVVTVRKPNGQLMGAGRTFLTVPSGTYSVTTTVRYRTFTTTGYVTKTLATAGDTLSADFNAASIAVPDCAVTRLSLDGGETPDNEPGTQSGSFDAVCDVLYTNGTATVTTGSTSFDGTVEGVYSDPDEQKFWTYSWDGGSSANQRETDRFDNLTQVRLSQDVTHMFPVRKYNAQKAVQKLQKSLTFYR